MNKTYILLTLSFILFFACKEENKKESQVIILESADPGSLNAFNFLSGEAGYMMPNLHSTLLGMDFKNGIQIPLVATSLPEISRSQGDSTFLVHYTIRPEAKFDDQEEITGKDFLFSLKVVQNPFTNSHRIRPGLDFIKDVRLDPQNPKNVTFVCSEMHILTVVSTGDLIPLQESFYDKKGLLKNYSLEQITHATDTSSLPGLKEFAEEFNSEKYQRDSAFISGSGPYRLTFWETGQKLVFTRKQNWWGDHVHDKNDALIANPGKIIYQIINNQTAAANALKAGEVDIVRAIKTRDFLEFQKDSSVISKYHLFTPKAMLFSYLGINTKLHKLSDVRVRRALSHLLDVNSILESIYFNLGDRVRTSVHPSKSYYNEEVPFIEFSIAKADSILKEAGWKDTDKNGILDKVLQGKKTELSLIFSYISGNEERKAIGLMLREAALKVGMEITIVAFERDVFFKNQKKHDFEIFSGAWIGHPFPEDFKQIFHTTSWNGGANYFGFGDAASDALVDSIRYEMNETTRNAMAKRLQWMIHEQIPFVPMFSLREKIAISKKYSNAFTTHVRPGYRETLLIED